MEEALGAEASERPRAPQVALGQSIVAVNDVFADVGLMQQQLLSQSQARTNQSDMRFYKVYSVVIYHPREPFVLLFSGTKKKAYECGKSSRFQKI